MGLTGLEIFKKLPQTNCGDCGFPTCLAFAMRLAAGQEELEKCPHVSEEAKAELSDASAPPIRKVTIGVGDTAFTVGEEQVLFRHDKTFYNPTAFAVLISDDEDEAAVNTKLEQVNKNRFERIAQLLRANAVAVRCSSGDSGKFKTFVERIKGATDLPLILMGEADVLGAALEVCADTKPLLYAATEANIDAMVALAKDKAVPLVVQSETLDGLAALTEKAEAAGVKDLVLEPASRSLSENLRDLTLIRRAALKQKFKPLGYPTIALPALETQDSYQEAMRAAVYLMKYGSIVVLSSLEQWKAMSLFTLRQNIFTDPQQPMQVESKIYNINGADADSPVLITTNFSLTYFIVSGEIEASKKPAWLVVMDSDGLSVLTGWAAGKFVPERIAAFIKKAGVKDMVSHNKLIIPGYVAQISGELEEELGGDWEVIVGVREAGDLPAYLKSLAG